MNGIAEQDLHMARPGSQGIALHHGLQIAQLVRQAKLALSGRRFQLRRPAIADPHFCLMARHHIFDNIRTAIEANDMQDSCHRAEHPLPPILSVYTAAGFIGMDDCALLKLLLNRLDLLASLACSTLHDPVNPARADFNTMQIAQGCFSTRITYMLLLAIVHYRRFQSCTKRSLHFKTGRRLTNLFLSTTRTRYRILSHFNHFRFCRWQFRDLIDIFQPRPRLTQISLTNMTNPRFHFSHMIRLRYPFAVVFEMTQRRAMSALFSLRRQVTFPIPRGWLRRIAGIRGRLLALFQLQA